MCTIICIIYLIEKYLSQLEPSTKHVHTHCASPWVIWIWSGYITYDYIVFNRRQVKKTNLVSQKIDNLKWFFFQRANNFLAIYVSLSWFIDLCLYLFISFSLLFFSLYLMDSLDPGTRWTNIYFSVCCIPDMNIHCLIL